MIALVDIFDTKVPIIEFAFSFPFGSKDVSHHQYYH